MEFDSFGAQTKNEQEGEVIQTLSYEPESRQYVTKKLNAERNERYLVLANFPKRVFTIERNSFY